METGDSERLEDQLAGGTQQTWFFQQGRRQGQTADLTLVLWDACAHPECTHTDLCVGPSHGCLTQKGFSPISPPGGRLGCRSGKLPSLHAVRSRRLWVAPLHLQKPVHGAVQDRGRLVGRPSAILS